MANDYCEMQFFSFEREILGFVISKDSGVMFLGLMPEVA